MALSSFTVKLGQQPRKMIDLTPGTGAMLAIVVSNSGPGELVLWKLNDSGGPMDGTGSVLSAGEAMFMATVNSMKFEASGKDCKVLIERIP